ncbi:hypothetical protein V6Z12_A08G192200 [Gossypium hirsutum]|uniref:Uncharacterized protein n=1 Tax=Gossypium tomentosum TaxID=34277 RepID=A0A5D2PL67_GOSTO|nr:hypothetical protein ES332_A08G198200v1 [Gossypium tomentosum]
MFRPSNLRTTVDSISLKRISLMRSEKAIAGIPLTIEVFMSPSRISKSPSFLPRFLAGFPSEEATPQPKSLSLNDIIGCCSESTTILVSSITTASLKRTFLVFNHRHHKDHS